jgi:acyl-coenzyme A thioesterase PaaI-like protein
MPVILRPQILYPRFHFLDTIPRTMPLIELPHTPNCLVCGRENAHGLHLHLYVDEANGIVRTRFTPQPHHVGLDGIVHGGVIATVLDEAMVWAATWTGRRFCLCGEMTVRFRRKIAIGEHVDVEASVTTGRTKLLKTVGTVFSSGGELLAESTGKYVPLEEVRHRSVVATFINDPTTDRAADRFRN